MSDFDKQDKGLQPNQRWGGDNLNSEVPQKFPFEAFETSDPNDANPVITVKSPWFLTVEGTFATATLSVTSTATIADLVVTDSVDFQKGATTPFLHVQDQKTSGTASGAFTLGAWRTRTLNTVLTNTITGASRSGNQITLPSGTYYIEGIAPAFKVARHQLRLRNTTDGSNALIGISSYASTAGDDNNNALVGGRITIIGIKVFELQHQGAVTTATRGFGVECGASFTVDHETFADIKIWQLA